MNDGDRLAPVTLTGEYPVAKLEILFSLAYTLLGKPLSDGLFSLSYTFAIKKTGVYESSRLNISKRFVLHISAGDNLDDRQTKLLCKLPVSRIMCRNRHDSTGSVTHENIIRNPDRDLCIIHRIDRSQTLDNNTCFVLGKFGPLEVRLSCSLLTVLEDSIPVFDLVFIFIQIRMLRRNNHISSTKERIRSRGIDCELLLLAGKLEVDLSTI